MPNIEVPQNETETTSVALVKVIDALRPLNSEQRSRVMRSAATFYGDSVHIQGQFTKRSGT